MTLQLSDIHTIPEYEGLIADVDDSEFIEVLDSIREIGQIYPIIVNGEGVVLDGHYRYRACRQLRIEVKYEERNFPSKDHEFIFVADCALARKNLNTFRRTEVALKLKPYLENIAEENRLANLKQGDHSPSHLIKGFGGQGVNDEIGKRANVGHDTVRKSEKIIESKNEALIQDVRAGNKSINEGYREITKANKKRDLSRVEPIGITSDCDLRLGDFTKCGSEILDNSIDLIFTDPPYDKASTSLYGELAKLAARVLKPGASLVVYTAQHHLPDIIDQMKVEGLKYWWIMCVKHRGPSARLHGQHVFIGWKPLLWYVKGTKLATPEYISDFIESEKPPEKVAHKWQQSLDEATTVISKLTEQNQLVLDPMLGGGTTAIAARKLNRKFLGIEMNSDSLEMAKRNIAEGLK